MRSNLNLFAKFPFQEIHSPFCRLFYHNRKRLAALHSTGSSRQQWRRPLDQQSARTRARCLRRNLRVSFSQMHISSDFSFSFRYFNRYPTAFSQAEYEGQQCAFCHHFRLQSAAHCYFCRSEARRKWTELTCLRPKPCSYIRQGVQMQTGATNFLAVLHSMFPRLYLSLACMMRDCSQQQLSEARARARCIHYRKLTLKTGV